jgi:hypothetical protein
MGKVRDRIQSEVESWAGITSAPHRFGGIEFLLNGMEIGHLHGDHLLDIAFSKNVRDALIAEGHAEPHHVMPESGWISFWLRKPEDTDHGLWLLRLAYLRHVLLLRRKRHGAEAVATINVPNALASLNLSPALTAIFENLSNRQATGAEDSWQVHNGFTS